MNTSKKILTTTLITVSIMSSAFCADFFNFTADKHYELEIAQSIDSPFKIAIHKYRSEKLEKELFISIHGYLDNCGYFQDLHRQLFAKNFDVFCMDLPGHGLSSGVVADIENFEQYGDMLKLLDYDVLKKQYTKIHFIAHSTGAVSYLEYRKEFKAPFDKVIFIAPLVRSKHWRKSMLLHTIARRFIKRVPRRTNGTPRFLELKAMDKHYIDHTTATWITALKKWEKKIKDYTNTFEDNIHLIYGEKDNIIINDYSQEVYSRIFSKAKFYEIGGASHHMDLDPPEVSKLFYDKLDEIIQKY